MRTGAVCNLSWWVAIAVVISIWIASTGCGVDGYARNVEFTHWHDDETIVLVYTRKQTIGAFGSQPETTHVRICTIEDDNTILCNDQRRLTNMLNPHVDDIELRERWRP